MLLLTRRILFSETEQFVMELDEDTEGLQATVFLLQKQLKEAKEHISNLEGQPTNDLTGSHTPTTAETPEMPEVTENPTSNSVVTEEEHLQEILENGVTEDGSESTPMESEELTPSETYADKKVTSNVTNGHTEMVVN